MKNKQHNSLIFLLVKFVITFLFLPIIIVFLFLKKRFVKRRLRKNVRKFYSVLSLKRHNGTKMDDYKNEITKDWEKDIKYFVENTCHLSFKKGYIKLVNKYLDKLEKNRDVSNSSNLDGWEYENLICLRLKSLGFKAEVTPGSGDQGADVLAERAGKTFVIQCKYYSKPVGNKAVQEAFSGQHFYNTNYAVVVTNTSYTKSAKSLADKSKVILLNDKELEKLLRI